MAKEFTVTLNFPGPLSSMGLLFPFSFLSLSLFGGGVDGGIVFSELCINDHFDKGTKALILTGTVFEVRVTAIIMKTSFPGD